MQTIKLILTGIAALTISACHTTKQATTTASYTPQNNTGNTAPPFPLVQPVDVTPAPGNNELIAIQAKYIDVTLEKLKEGHAIYTQGACVNCHGAANVYQYDETKWKEIIDDMAPKAYLSDTQKDAVYKYVLSIKATQPK